MTEEGPVSIINCFHVGSLLSAAGLHHFLLLRVNAPQRSDQKGSINSEVSGRQKHDSDESPTRICAEPTIISQQEHVTYNGLSLRVDSHKT